MPSMIKPFLRWAGGKQWISRRIAQLIPSDIGTYFEPFLGGGSVYFAVQPSTSVLSDLNPRLVETYQELRDRPLEVMDALGRWQNEEGVYYQVRKREFDDSIHRAAQFIYLNRTCWNGLYRVNKQGKFNVPFGYHGREIFDEKHLKDVSEALKHAEVCHGDFDQVLSRAEKGDFVYLDPPYTSLHQKNGFRQYNESLFSWDDQKRLARTAAHLAKRGVTVLVSNANHGSVVDLYPGFFCLPVARHSILAAHSEHRRPTSELLIASDLSLSQRIADEVIRNYDK